MKTTSSGIAVVLLVAMLAVQSAVADISCSDVPVRCMHGFNYTFLQLSCSLEASD
uniref:Uncharacterized protein n=1 Tax=Zea mays TaxID=4577 RepID=B6TBW3_MAIZE|nr:hypothetical protein [Zea mays]